MIDSVAQLVARLDAVAGLLAEHVVCARSDETDANCVLVESSSAFD